MISLKSVRNISFGKNVRCSQGRIMKRILRKGATSDRGYSFSENSLFARIVFWEFLLLTWIKDEPGVRRTVLTGEEGVVFCALTVDMGSFSFKLSDLEELLLKTQIFLRFTNSKGNHDFLGGYLERSENALSLARVAQLRRARLFGIHPGRNLTTILFHFSSSSAVMLDWNRVMRTVRVAPEAEPSGAISQKLLLDEFVATVPGGPFDYHFSVR